MSWWDRLWGRDVHDVEQQQDDQALQDLRTSFKEVHSRTERLEAELLRINADIRARQAAKVAKH